MVRRQPGWVSRKRLIYYWSLLFFDSATIHRSAQTDILFRFISLHLTPLSCTSSFFFSSSTQSTPLYNMMQVNSLLRFSAVCPFLGHSTTSSLRTMASNNANNVSQLTASALKCPMMGPKLAAISHARTYASVAGSKEVEAIHKVSIS